jgi:hypothetical protein
MSQSKKLCFVITREGLGELPRPSALRTRLMHFPLEIIIPRYFRIPNYTPCRDHSRPTPADLVRWQWQCCTPTRQHSDFLFYIRDPHNQNLDMRASFSDSLNFLRPESPRPTVFFNNFQYYRSKYCLVWVINLIGSMQKMLHFAVCFMKFP